MVIGGYADPQQHPAAPSAAALAPSELIARTIPAQAPPAARRKASGAPGPRPAAAPMAMAFQYAPGRARAFNP